MTSIDWLKHKDYFDITFIKVSVVFHFLEIFKHKWVDFDFHPLLYIYIVRFHDQELLIFKVCLHHNRTTALHFLAPVFLIGAEILTKLILNNPQINGISIEESEFKITKFADDTTLILDGSQQSLPSALNTMEIYRNYSGLKMNKEKNESNLDWAEKILKIKARCYNGIGMGFH